MAEMTPEHWAEIANALEGWRIARVQGAMRHGDGSLRLELERDGWSAAGVVGDQRRTVVLGFNELGMWLAGEDDWQRVTGEGTQERGR